MLAATGSKRCVSGSWRLSVGLLISFLAVTTTEAQEKGDASLRIEYQYISTGNFHDANTEFDWWTTDSHVALLSGDYAITDRVTVYAALPYVQKRFNGDPQGLIPGGDPHNPNDPWWVDFVPTDKRFIDDGDYHGGLQDLTAGVRYAAIEGPAWTVSPYIAYGVPTDDYPYYAKAAIGANLWNIPVGVDVSYVPYFSDWYLTGNLAYVFSEEPLDINVDYWLAYLSGGYWFQPRFSMNLFVSAKYLRNGLIMPWDFTDDPFYSNYPGDFDTEEWYNHDRLLRHRYVNLGVGFDYFFKENYQLSGTYFQGIWVEQANEVDSAFTVALTRFFNAD
ncbi:MAG TPA: transporter [Xanthomonadales bacterium]|nr:transporter [Xanthomonadales bacterium]